jgi:tRNA (guanine37-N1)-methyltransferase
MKNISCDLIGNIAILNFKRNTFFLKKKINAYILLRKNTNIKTILEKKEKIEGILRIPKLKFLAGKKDYETYYKENNCLFKFNVKETYFSPRLSNERNRISEEVLNLSKKIKNPRILVMFAGVYPYPIVLAKKLKLNKIKAKIYVNELNKKANFYGKENIKLNKVDDYIQFCEGDAKDLPKKLNQKFDIILMPRPNLEETFLDICLKLSKKGTKVFYHGFGKKEEVINEIEKKLKGKYQNFVIRKAGEIAPYKYRWQVNFSIK